MKAYTLAVVSAQDQPERRGGRDRGPVGAQRMLERIADDLALNEDQRALWQELNSGQQEQFEQWRLQMRELRQAQRDGDEARATEISEQLQADGAWDPMQSLEQSLQQLEPTLTPEQQERYTDVTERMQRRREAFEARRAQGGGPGGMRGPGRMIDRVAEDLKLSDEQRASAEEIAGRLRERMEQVAPIERDLRRARREGDTKRVEELEAQMQALGTNSQESMGQAMDELGSILDEGQSERFSEMRQGMERWRQARDFNQAAEYEIPNALGLDEQQRTQYEDYLRSNRRAQREQWQQMRSIRREMRDAQEAGDQERVDALQLELEMIQQDPSDQRSEFLDGLHGMLRADQVQALERFYPNVAVAGADRTYDVHTILRAALRAGLDKDQRAQWRVIMREAMQSTHELRRKDKDAEAAIAADTRAKIEALLNDAQQQRFEKALKRSGRSRRR